MKNTRGSSSDDPAKQPMKQLPRPPSSSEEQLERLLAEGEFSIEQVTSVLKRRGMLEGILNNLSGQVLMDMETSCLTNLHGHLSLELESRSGLNKRFFSI